MLNSIEKNSAVQKSADPMGSADSLRENQGSPSLEQLNYKTKQQKEQSISREKIDTQEHLKADIDLEKDLEILKPKIINLDNFESFINEKFGGNKKAYKIGKDILSMQLVFDIDVTSQDLSHKIKGELLENRELSTADKIKVFKEQLSQEGKSPTIILQTLITKFENEEAVSVWVDNWKNYLKLHQFAENKPPVERKAIQKIISRANFSDENSFDSSLIEIAQSSDISNITKLEIFREFDGAKVFSVNQMDAGLKQLKNRKNKVSKALNAKSQTKKYLDLEIKTLEKELEKLSHNDPKRKELENKITQREEALKQTNTEIVSLKIEKAKDVSFQLRDGISAKLNSDGSRSINISSEDFSIKIPSNFLPFSGNRNLRSINIAFPYLALRSQNIADVIFKPNLSNDSIPSHDQRNLGHLILDSLGIPDDKILSEFDISQMKTDLLRLTSLQSGKTGQECLIDLGIYDISTQNIDKVQFKKVLVFIRENRGLRDDLFGEKMEKLVR